MQNEVHFTTVFPSTQLSTWILQHSDWLISPFVTYLTYQWNQSLFSCADEHLDTFYLFCVHKFALTRPVILPPPAVVFL